MDDPAYAIPPDSHAEMREWFRREVFVLWNDPGSARNERYVGKTTAEIVDLLNIPIGQSRNEAGEIVGDATAPPRISDAWSEIVNAPNIITAEQVEDYMNSVNG